METLAIVVGILVVLAIIAVAAWTVTRGRRNVPSIRPLPPNLIQPYESRLPELERLFVSQPRESVAAAKLLVDDMFNRIGYPVRMANEERVRDLRGRHRSLADLYRRASSIKAEPSTEQLRRSLQEYLEIAHRLLEEASRDAHNSGGHRHEMA